MEAPHCPRIREINIQSHFSERFINSMNLTASRVPKISVVLKTCRIVN